MEFYHILVVIYLVIFLKIDYKYSSVYLKLRKSCFGLGIRFKQGANIYCDKFYRESYVLLDPHLSFF